MKNLIQELKESIEIASKRMKQLHDCSTFGIESKRTLESYENDSKELLTLWNFQITATITKEFIESNKHESDIKLIKRMMNNLLNRYLGFDSRFDESGKDSTLKVMRIVFDFIPKGEKRKYFFIDTLLNYSK